MWRLPTGSERGSARRISVTVPAQMAGLIDDLLASGRYGTRSEIVREGLRRLWDELEETGRGRVPSSSAGSAGGPASEEEEDPEAALEDDPVWQAVQEHRRKILRQAEACGILEVWILLQPEGLLNARGRLELLVTTDPHTPEAVHAPVYCLRVEDLIDIPVWVEFEHQLMVPLGFRGVQRLKERSILLGKRERRTTFDGEPRPRRREASRRGREDGGP